jgi:hypothetical protein
MRFHSFKSLYTYLTQHLIFLAIIVVLVLGLYACHIQSDDFKHPEDVNTDTPPPGSPDYLLNKHHHCDTEAPPEVIANHELPMGTIVEYDYSIWVYTTDAYDIHRAMLLGRQGVPDDRPSPGRITNVAAFCHRSQM